MKKQEIKEVKEKVISEQIVTKMIEVAYCDNCADKFDPRRARTSCVNCYKDLCPECVVHHSPYDSDYAIDIPFCKECYEKYQKFLRSLRDFRDEQDEQLDEYANEVASELGLKYKEYAID